MCDQVNARPETVPAIAHWAAGRANKQIISGADAGVIDPPPVQVPAVVADSSQAFVKVLGEGANRVPLSFATIEEIERTGCHWAALLHGSDNSRKPPLPVIQAMRFV